jgi:hypothetical protein
VRKEIVDIEIGMYRSAGTIIIDTIIIAARTNNSNNDANVVVDRSMSVFFEAVVSMHSRGISLINEPRIKDSFLTCGIKGYYYCCDPTHLPPIFQCRQQSYDLLH